MKNLYLTVFIHSVGFSMVFPLLPFYAQIFHATAFQIGILAASQSLANFLAAPLMGRISDRVGRKLVLTVGLFLGTFSLALTGLANSLALLFIGRILHGSVVSAIFPTARAYVGDVTTKGERVAAMGKIGAAFSAGLLIGPAFGSFLVGFGGIHVPFFAAAAISMINTVAVTILLKESLKVKAQKLVIKEGFLNFITVFKNLRGKPSLLFLSLFVWSFAQSNNTVAFPLFVEKVFKLGAQEIGYFFTAQAIVSILVQGFLLSWVVSWLGEKATIIWGLSIMGMALFLIPISPTIPFLMASFMMMILGGTLNRPTAEGIISRTAEEGQGTTMGIAQSFESLGRVTGPLMGGSFFGILAAAPFIFSGTMLFIIALAILLLLNIRNIKTSDVEI